MPGVSTKNKCVMALVQPTKSAQPARPASAPTTPFLSIVWEEKRKEMQKKTSENEKRRSNQKPTVHGPFEAASANISKPARKSFRNLARIREEARAYLQFIDSANPLAHTVPKAENF
jgi:hypothetical protein